MRCGRLIERWWFSFVATSGKGTCGYPRSWKRKTMKEEAKETTVEYLHMPLYIIGTSLD